MPSDKGDKVFHTHVNTHARPFTTCMYRGGLMFYADRRVPTVSATRNNNTQHMCVTNTTHNIFHAMHSPNTRQTNSMRIVWYKTVTSSEMDTGHTARMTPEVVLAFLFDAFGSGIRDVFIEEKIF